MLLIHSTTLVHWTFDFHKRNGSSRIKCQCTANRSTDCNFLSHYWHGCWTCRWVARSGQSSSTHSNNLDLVSCYIWRTVVHSVRTVNQVLHCNGSTFAITALLSSADWPNLTIISCLPACIFVRARVYCTTDFNCAFFTCAFHTRVVYMRLHYPLNSTWCTLHYLR